MFRTLPNRLRVVTDPMASVRSCSIGLWVGAGSRCERPDEGGLAHFIEHMLFKGTSTRDTDALADAINRLGGHVNAYTTQEAICLHAHTVDAKAARALDLLAEMLTDSIWPDDEIPRERGVVLEEWRAVSDTPEDLSVDAFMEALWPGHPLGRPILGTAASIRRFSRPAIERYRAREFRPGRIVLSIAGRFDARACRRVIERRLTPLTAASRRRAATRATTPPDAAPRRTCLRRPVQAAHFCLGVRTPGLRSRQRHALGMMNMILGGSMGSRLWREIRERRGLAYSIGSFLHFFGGRGAFAVSGATAPGRLDEVLALTVAEVERLAENAPSDDEMELAREQVVDGLLMSMESTQARMSRGGESLLAYDRVIPVAETLTALRAVTPDDVRRMARRHLTDRAAWAAAVLGPDPRMRATLQRRLG